MRQPPLYPFLLRLSLLFLLFLLSVIFHSSPVVLAERTDVEDDHSTSEFLAGWFWLSVAWKGAKLAIALSPLLFICYIFFTNRTNDPRYQPSRKPDFSFNVD
eukprot:GHVS01038789.1.p1 GENE.GHVS01038789.1~~GHVS01038789.1.p1  ORF type:complete len:102 (-),score=19.11 GHVS01038789.1:474-779(-)